MYLAVKRCNILVIFSILKLLSLINPAIYLLNNFYGLGDRCYSARVLLKCNIFLKKRMKEISFILFSGKKSYLAVKRINTYQHHAKIESFFANCATTFIQFLIAQSPADITLTCLLLLDTWAEPRGGTGAGPPPPPLNNHKI